MNDRFSVPQLEHLKRIARDLRRADTSLSLAAALNQVARDSGWPNWPLLMKNSLPAANEVVRVTCGPFPGGMPGVLLVEMAIEDKELRHSIAGGPLTFELPEWEGWLFRGAGLKQYEGAPYIERRTGRPRGVFVEHQWRAILSTNGVQPADIQEHMATTLASVLRDLKAGAFAALLPYIAGIAPTAGGRVRLFCLRPGQNGVAEIAERAYASVAEAKSAELPDGWVRIGIPLSDGKWLTHQMPFGWSE